MKHHLNDELFIDYKAPVVAKKSKPALANLSSAEVTVSVLSQCFPSHARSVLYLKMYPKSRQKLKKS